jgi:hypothetical protein
MTEIDEPRIIPTADFPFQVFLKQIADQITDEEVKSLKFLWSGTYMSKTNRTECYV